jgi:hypothetical protein
MANTKRILIDENKTGAETRIREIRQTATVLTALIRSYNDLPVLENITRADQCKDFLTSPIAYMDRAVLNDTGISLGKIQPDPAAVAGLFKIPYNSILQKINAARVKLTDLKYLVFDENSITIEVLESSIQEIKEESRIWLSDPDVIKAYNSVKTLCDAIMAYAEEYHMTPSDLNALPAYMGLRCVVNPSGKGWILTPNIDLIKKHLKHNN